MSVCQIHANSSRSPVSPQRAGLGMQTSIDPDLFMSQTSQDSVTLRTNAPSPTATGAPESKTFNFNPQDRRVMESGTTVLDVVQGPRGPETDRVKLNDGLEPLNGQFVYPPSDPRRAKAETFAAVSRCINLFKKYYGDFSFAFGDDKLGVFADSGKMLQGFYKREQKAIICYHNPDPIYGGNVFTGASNDVASHETGHSILDGIRPNYYLSTNPEPRAFHEAFGDCLAIHSGLCDDRVVARVAVQTGGDLSKPNVAARIAEEMGIAVNNDDGANTTGGDYLRDANNTFKYVDPSTLPEKSPMSELSWNNHNFSRVWTGAHFDLLKLMVNEQMAHGADPKKAIAAANDECLQMLANMLKEAPQFDFTFKDMANAMLTADAKHRDGKRLDLIKQAFVGRNILPADAPLPEVPAKAADPSLFQSVTLTSFPEDEPKPVVARTLSLPLDESFGPFQGATVELPVDPDLDEEGVSAAKDRTYANMRNLVDAGRVRYTDSRSGTNFPQDYLNADGHAYTAALFYEGDQKVIRALPFAMCG